jgi:hypothetical protein
MVEATMSRWLTADTTRRAPFFAGEGGHHDKILVALMLSYAGLNLTNTSLFTSLYSGGLVLLLLVLYLMPRTGELARGLDAPTQAVRLPRAERSGTT